MDIRDTKNIEIEPYSPGHGFEQLWALQSKLLDNYIKIESLPSYPINPHLKINQILLKDFIARITEEIGEGHESLRNGVTVFTNSRTGESVPHDLTYNYFNLYEELSDALHFFMELFIYLGLTEDFLKTVSLYGVLAPTGEGTLEILWEKAETHLGWVCSKFSCLGEVADRPESFKDLAVDFKELKPDPTNYRKIFNYKTAYFLYPHIAWLSTYHLQLARNAMKNKPWKQTEMVSDKSIMQSNIRDSFILYLSLCRLLGLSVESLYHLYCRKNHINHFRIISKY